MKKTKAQDSIISRQLITELIAAGLLMFFIHTLISTYVQLQSLKNLLAFYTKNVTVVSWSIIILEIVISVALFIKTTRRIGFVLILLTAIVAGVTILTHPGYPYDFGGILNMISNKMKWFVLGTLVILSATGLILGMPKHRQRITSSDENTVVYT